MASHNLKHCHHMFYSEFMRNSQKCKLLFTNIHSLCHQLSSGHRVSEFRSDQSDSRLNHILAMCISSDSVIHLLSKQTSLHLS